MSGRNNQRRALLTLVLLVAAGLRLWNLDGVPPGINGDEIFNAIDAGKIGGNAWPVYFPGNNGRESLFFYLVAVSVRLVGDNVLALRLPAAFCGLLAVPLAYRLGGALRGWRTGAVAAALLALSFWPLLHARWGLRAVTLTLFSGLTIWLYWQARSTGRLSLWLAAGAALGLTFYTYIPGLIFPLLIPLWLALLFWYRPALRRSALKPALLSLGVAVVTMIPFLVYVIRFPEQVNQRIGTLYSTTDAVQQGDFATALRAVADGVGFLAWSGDPTWRYNIAGRPAFSIPVALLLGTGILLALWRAWRGPARRRADYALLLFWFGALYAPNLMVPGDVSALRPAGAVIPAMLFVALAVERGAGGVRGTALRRAAWGIAVVGLLLVGGRTAHDYFNVWAAAPETRHIYGADLALLSDALTETPPPPGTRVLAGVGYAREITHATRWGYLGGREVAWFERGETLAWPGTAPAWIFVPAGSVLPPGAETLLAASAGAPLTFADGMPAWTRYELSGPRTWSPALPDPAEYENAPRFLGYDVAREALQGETIPVVLHWEIPPGQERLPNEMTFVSLRLRDALGGERGRADQLLAYPQSSWRSGDRFVQLVRLAVPAGMLPGPATLDVQLFDAEGRTYSRERVAEPQAHLLIQRQSATDPIPAPGDVVFGERLALQNASLSTILAPGLNTYVVLEWLVLEDLTRDYPVRLSVTERGAGAALFGQDDDVLTDIYPPSRWRRGDRVTTLHELAVPLDLEAAGELTLRVQVVDPSDGTPLPVTQGTDAVTALTVEQRARRFEAPPPGTALDLEVGDAFTLLGYDLDRRTVAPGGTVALTLYWQARARPDRNYTVFNHLLDEAGQIRGQLDSPPVGEAWRTETWVPGEIVVERRVVPVEPDAPAGTYQLLVGLYDPETVTRLPVTLDGGEIADGISLGPIEVTP